MKLSRLLFVILGIPLAIFAYQAFTSNGENALWMVPFLVAIAIVYVMAPQIDWHFSRRYPPKLPKEFIKSLEIAFPFYADLDQEGKRTFQNRVSWIGMAKDFTPKPDHSIPFDVSHGIASCIAALTFHFEDFVIKNYEKVIVYKTSFPSPAFPKHVHACEINHEDKVILLATDKFMLGQNRPNEYFNTALYIWSLALEHYANELVFPEDTLDKVASVMKFSPAAIKKYIGLPELNNFGLLSTCYFMRPKEMEHQIPQLYNEMDHFYRSAS
jgi:Mlc titration factor MtfA (ptsG expression regulator)